MENLPPPIDTTPSLKPVVPPPDAPDAAAGGVSPVEVPPRAAPRPQVAALEFEGVRFRDVPLEFPFTWDGQRVDVVTVRRLLTRQVAELCPDGNAPDVFEVYAAMTGLPAPVLRGMDSDDGQAVAGAAWDFLPRLLRAAYSG